MPRSELIAIDPGVRGNVWTCHRCGMLVLTGLRFAVRNVQTGREQVRYLCDPCNDSDVDHARSFGAEGSRTYHERLLARQRDVRWM